MKRLIALWLAVLMLAAQPVQAAVCVGFGQAPAGGAVTQRRSPTGDVDSVYTMSSGTTRWELVDDSTDGTHDTDGTYISRADAVGTQRFSFPAFSIPAGATVNHVRIVAYGQKSAGASLTFRHNIWIGATPTRYYGTYTDLPSTTYILTEQVWAVNPATTAAWTAADINGGTNYVHSFEVGCGSVSAGEAVRFTEVWIEVSYET